MSYLTEIVQQIEIIQKSIIKQDIEKAWKKHPVGTVITRKDGRKYKKVSETGNSDKDWQLVTGDKSSSEEDSKERNKNSEQGSTKVNTKDLLEQAKNTSETALQNAIKQSPNPEVRQAAHQELERRKSEEVPQKEKSESEDKNIKLTENELKGNFALDLAEFIGSNKNIDLNKYKSIIEPYIFAYDVFRFWSDPNMKEKNIYSTSSSIDAIKQMAEVNDLENGIITKHDNVKGFDPYFVLNKFKDFAPKEEKQFIERTIKDNKYQKEIVSLDKLKVTNENTISEFKNGKFIQKEGFENSDDSDANKQNDSKNNINTLKTKLNEEFSKITRKIMDITDYSSNELFDLRRKQNELSAYIQFVNHYGDSGSVEKNSDSLKNKLNFEGEINDLFGDGEVLSLHIESTLDEMKATAIFEDGVSQRSFNISDRSVYMKNFYLNPLTEKGKGKGSIIFKNQVEQFKKLGFKKLTTDAAGGGWMNGYYTWARLGYEISDKEEVKILKDMLKSEEKYDFKKISSLQELMSTKEGRDWWKENGFSFTGVFDLNENSQSMKTLNEYRK